VVQARRLLLDYKGSSQAVAHQRPFSSSPWSRPSSSPPSSSWTPFGLSDVKAAPREAGGTMAAWEVKRVFALAHASVKRAELDAEAEKARLRGPEWVAMANLMADHDEAITQRERQNGGVLGADALTSASEGSAGAKRGRGVRRDRESLRGSPSPGAAAAAAAALMAPTESDDSRAAAALSTSPDAWKTLDDFLKASWLGGRGFEEKFRVMGFHDLKSFLALADQSEAELVETALGLGQRERKSKGGGSTSIARVPSKRSGSRSGLTDEVLVEGFGFTKLDLRRFRHALGKEQQAAAILKARNEANGVEDLKDVAKLRTRFPEAASLLEARKNAYRVAKDAIKATRRAEGDALLDDDDGENWRRSRRRRRRRRLAGKSSSFLHYQKRRRGLTKRRKRRSGKRGRLFEDLATHTAQSRQKHGQQQQRVKEVQPPWQRQQQLLQEESFGGGSGSVSGSVGGSGSGGALASTSERKRSQGKETSTRMRAEKRAREDWGESETGDQDGGDDDDDSQTKGGRGTVNNKRRIRRSSSGAGALSSPSLLSQWLAVAGFGSDRSLDIAERLRLRGFASPQEVSQPQAYAGLPDSLLLAPLPPPPAPLRTLSLKERLKEYLGTAAADSIFDEESEGSEDASGEEGRADRAAVPTVYGFGFSRLDLRRFRLAQNREARALEASLVARQKLVTALRYADPDVDLKKKKKPQEEEEEEEEGGHGGGRARRRVEPCAVAVRGGAWGEAL